MVSLKRYLDRGGQETPLWQVVSLLLEKIASESVVADEDDAAAFRADIHKLRDYIGQHSAAETIASAAESATLVMEAYNKGITALLQKRERDLKNVVIMMAETAAAVTGDKTPAVEKLRALDPDTLKQNLAECLRDFRQEMLRQKRDAESMIMDLRRDIERGPQPSAPQEIRETDPPTHLPLKDACVSAMHASIPPGKRRYVVTMVVNRLHSVNTRFGYEAGNRVLRWLGELIEQRMLPEDKLFRWRGPVLVALLERNEALDQIRIQIGRILDSRLELTLEVEGRPVLIPVSASWSAFQLVTTVSAAEKQIEVFAASQSGGE